MSTYICYDKISILYIANARLWAYWKFDKGDLLCNSRLHSCYFGSISVLYSVSVQWTKQKPGSSCIGQTLQFVPHKLICFYHITTAFIDHVYEKIRKMDYIVIYCQFNLMYLVCIQIIYFPDKTWNILKWSKTIYRYE